MKRFFIFFLSFVTVLTCIGGTSLAADVGSNTENLSLLYTTTKEERDQIFDAKMKELMDQLNSNIETRGPKYHYKSEQLPYKYKKVQGYAGGQLSGGYRFQTGGGFYYSESGGPDISGSVSLSLPAPFNFVSFSTNLGKKGSSGRFVTVPNTRDYFKLYVEKTVEVRPFVVYKKRSGTEGTWQIDHVGAVPMPYSINAYAKKV